MRLLFFLVIVLAIGCSTSKTSMVVADKYDKENNFTSLTLLPYGNINIPGKWTKTNYNEVSKQHFFVNQDSVSIAVTKNPQEKYPFFDSTMGDGGFILKYFDWEKEYYEKQGYSLKVIKERSVANFILWIATEKGVNTMFLFGAKNNFCYNFAIFKAYWTDAEKAEFLINLYDNN